MSAKFKMILTRKGKDFRKLGQRADALLANAMYSTAVDVLSIARKYARERTGRMKRELRMTKTGPLSYKIESPTPYGIYQEEGTRFMRGTHHMRRATIEGKPAAERRVERALKGLEAGE